MLEKIFFRKSDLFPVYSKSTDIESLNILIGKIIFDYFGENPVSFDINPTSTYHYVYHVILKQHEVFVKISKIHENKYTLYLEKYIYENIINNLNIGLKVFSIDINCLKYPFPFIILSKANGVCLRQIDIDSDFFYKIIRNLGKIVAQYHYLFCDNYGYGLIDIKTLIKTNKIQGYFNSWIEYLFLNVYEHLEFIRNYKVVNDKTIDFCKDLIKQILENKILSPQNEYLSCLLHGDLGSHNIFVNSNNHINSIIDWEDSLLGDPIYDIAMFASFYRMHEFLDHFLDGYNSIKELNYENFFLRFWIYYLRISIAKAVLRFKFGYDKIGESLSTPKIKMAIKYIEKYL